MSVHIEILHQYWNVRGSFLMRPRFDKTIAANTPGSEAAPSEPIKVYPNPTEGVVFIEGELSQLQVYDNWGQEASYQLSTVTNGVRVDLSMNKKGIYLLRFRQGGKVSYKRIILKD